MNTKYLYFLLLIFTLIASCRSPQKSFEKGDYNKAFHSALSELDKKNNMRQNKIVLNKSFQELLYRNDRRNHKLLTSGFVEDLEKVYDNNLEIIEKYHDAKRYLNTTYDTIAADFTYRNNVLKDEIAISYWDLANQQMEDYNVSGDKFKAQEAHLNYTKSLDYDIAYETIDSLLDISYLSGVIHVLVESNVWDMSYSWRIDNTFRNLIQLSRDFYQIHYESLISIADCRIDISFNNLEVVESQTRNTEQFTKEIQDGYNTVIDSLGNTQKVPKYITVSGQGITDRTTWSYTWRAMTNARQLSPFCRLNNSQFVTQRELIHDNYSYLGDERAVPEKYKRNTRFNRRSQEDRIIEIMIDDIYDDFVRYYFR